VKAPHVLADFKPGQRVRLQIDSNHQTYGFGTVVVNPELMNPRWGRYVAVVWSNSPNTTYSEPEHLLIHEEMIVVGNELRLKEPV